jgi:hypothetical protein
MALRRLLVAVCAAGLVMACSGQAQSCRPQSGDDAAVVQTIRSMFTAATNDDLKAFDALVEPGFYMYDNGQRFEGDAIMKLIGAAHAKGAKYVWNVTQPDVHVECDVAWVAYVNDGSVQPGPDKPAMPVKWLESAVLRRDGGTWKVVFFHSTREAQ